jgi:hypothetical protein
MELAKLSKYQQILDNSEGAPEAKKDSSFDHGPAFLGTPARKDVPDRCGTCHSDVTKMNPYGMPTDQLAQYRTSGHGRALFEKNNDRVAVCIDCHGTHAILPSKNPESTVYAKNVIATCARCHEDPEHMACSELSTTVVSEYRQSVHGQGLLEHEDTAMPHCASCHGSHSAIPPGFGDVGHVCGRCHQQEETHFLESLHAKFPQFPRCIACHTRNKRDHRILPIVTEPETLRSLYEQIEASTSGATLDDPKLREAFATQRQASVEQFRTICQRCHSPSLQVAHRSFFGEIDEAATQAGEELYELIRQAEFRYAATAVRTDQVGRGVLLVKEQALTVEELKTKLTGLGPMQHSLDIDRIRQAAQDLNQQADQVENALNRKIQSLEWRYWTLIPMWAFVVFFGSALWLKYKQLKAAEVEPPPA